MSSGKRWTSFGENASSEELLGKASGCLGTSPPRAREKEGEWRMNPIIHGTDGSRTAIRQVIFGRLLGAWPGRAGTPIVSVRR
jgi:hypothetical protein